MYNKTIEQHGFSDTDIERGIVTGSGNVELLIKRDTESVILYIDDVIAIARQMGITSRHLET